MRILNIESKPSADSAWAGSLSLWRGAKLNIEGKPSVDIRWLGSVWLCRGASFQKGNQDALVDADRELQCREEPVMDPLEFLSKDPTQIFARGPQEILRRDPVKRYLAVVLHRDHPSKSSVAGPSKVSLQVILILNSEIVYNGPFMGPAHKSYQETLPRHLAQRSWKDSANGLP